MQNKFKTLPVLLSSSAYQAHKTKSLQTFFSPPAVKLLLRASLQWKHNKDVVSALLSLSCSRKLLVEPLVVVSGLLFPHTNTRRGSCTSVRSNVNKPQRSRLSSPACCISHSLSQSHGKTCCVIYGFTYAGHIPQVVASTAIFPHITTKVPVQHMKNSYKMIYNLRQNSLDELHMLLVT